MVETAHHAHDAALRRDAILEAVAFAAEQLLLAEDWRLVAGGVVARLGAGAGVSRAYVIENGLDTVGRPTSKQRAEWCAPGCRRRPTTPC